MPDVVDDSVGGDLLVLTRDGAVHRVETDGVDISWTQWKDDATVSWMGLRGIESVAGNWSQQSLTILWKSAIESCGEMYPASSLAADGGFVVVRESDDRFPEIAATTLDGRMKTLVSFDHPGTEYIRKVGGTTARYSWTAPDGLKLEGLLTLPDGAGPSPLVVLIHGGQCGHTGRNGACSTTTRLGSRR